MERYARQVYQSIEVRHRSVATNKCNRGADKKLPGADDCTRIVNACNVFHHLAKITQVRHNAVAVAEGTRWAEVGRPGNRTCTVYGASKATGCRDTWSEQSAQVRHNAVAVAERTNRSRSRTDSR